ncbi:hypothetical protein [Nocardiopsis quinghaiensis]|uniref:hypothetical protein n=1 Tax=Nocardiopsis quinghaiensis TaxID=464995 RepID=UPI0037439853
MLAQAVLFTAFGPALRIPGSGRGVVPEQLPLFLGMGVVLGCIRLITRNVWACVGSTWPSRPRRRACRTDTCSLSGATRNS